MLPDTLAQLIDALPRQPNLEPARLRALIQHLPDPQAAAQEMLRRGWITQHQFSSLFPVPQQQQAGRETLLLGSGGDDSPPDAASEDWLLPLGDEEDQASAPPAVVWARPDRTQEPMRPQPRTAQAVPALSGAASLPELPWDRPVPPVAGGNEARPPDKRTDQPLRQWLVFASKGMLMCTLFFGADGLNCDKTYLSKWLGVYGGSSAKTYLNDGRPIVGIAGMRSKNAKGPLFCFCLVTTKAGALADAEGHELIMGGQR
jgi:hypothetical protein